MTVYIPGAVTYPFVSWIVVLMVDASLDFDVSLIWDRISEPATDAAGVTPEPDDYRLTVGVTYTY